MLDPTRSRPGRRSLRGRVGSLTVIVAVVAALLTVGAWSGPAHAVPATAVPATAVPAHAVPATAVPATAVRSAAPAAGTLTATSMPAAARLHELDARAGRSGTKLRTLYVAVSISSSDPAGAGHPKALVQQRRSGKWRTVGTIRIPQAEGPPLTFTWRSKKAATLRVKVKSLGLVSPTMKVPAAPTSTKSRYYVRKDKAGDGGEVLRVFKGGTAYGIEHAGMEYSCVAGRLDKPWLRLTSFDFGGWHAKYRTTGSWKRLKIDDDATPVGGPRTSLSGHNKRLFRFCADPAFAAVTTDPNGL